MTDLSHLNALQLRLSHEREYLRDAKTDGEKALRGVWISQIEKEIAREREFLDLTDEAAPDMTDDELLAALEG